VAFIPEAHMKLFFRLLLMLILAALAINGCSLFNASPTADAPASAEDRTLASLKKVEDFPLYTMTYYGDYENLPRSMAAELAEVAPSLEPAWGCTLFAALGDPSSRLYGRNFDWEYSPALLLLTHPADGYAAVSMVDLAYLVDERDAKRLADLSIEKRQALLQAPLLPFDGMNEAGVAIGMAAVPAGNVARDPARETIGSIKVIREVLDHASSVDEAAAIFQKYNLEWAGGPTMHYLIADRSGQAILVEYSGTKMTLIRNAGPWHLATNFLVDQAGDQPESMCPRYARVSQRLKAAEGRLAPDESMKLLSAVAQSGSGANTQWSVVYDISTGEVRVVMGRQYEQAVFKTSISGWPGR
jgi:hypothetical protein